MNKLMMTAALAAVLSLAHGSETAITMYQDPYCGCCSGWADHMRESGFDVKVIKTGNMASVKQALGVPVELGSCHTAVVDSTRQIVEGHVRSEEHTSELQSRGHLVCRLLLEK